MSNRGYDFSFLRGADPTGNRSYRMLDLVGNSKHSLPIRSYLIQAEQERRRIMVVFDVCPLDIHTQPTEGRPKYEVDPGRHCFPNNIAVLFERLCNLGINRHYRRALDLRLHDLDKFPAGVDREQVADLETVRDLLDCTTFLFTFYCGVRRYSYRDVHTHTRMIPDAYGYVAEDLETANSRFEATLESFKPHSVLSLGTHAYAALTDRLEQNPYKSYTSPYCFLGSHRFYKNIGYVHGLEISQAVLGEKTYFYASLLGMAANQIAVSLLGFNPYDITSKTSWSMITDPQEQRRYKVFDPASHNYKLVDTMEKFEAFLTVMRTQPYVAIDTETAGLNRVQNRIAMIQFAFNSKTGYLIPLQHHQSPFNGQQLVVIFDRLRDFFEGNNSNRYHIYTNATYDLTIIKAVIGVRFFANNVWDILAGEYGLDENAKFLYSLFKFYYYSLLNTTVSYGCDVYLTAPFSKEHRATIAVNDLTHDVCNYCSYDVVLPMAVFFMQRQRAVDRGFKGFTSLVGTQMSDMIHNFSCMEFNGMGLDIDYLMLLKSADSPVNEEIARLERDLLKDPACVEANGLLLKQRGIPKTGLFTIASPPQLFSLRTRKHLDLLFFDVLGLEQEIVGKSGQKKLDATFQKKYADNPTMALYTALNKSKKIATGFINQFLHFWNHDDDFRVDRRIRPHFHFDKVITGRTSASKPSLQQIPNRSVLGKLIKRLFIAEEGRLYIKVDFSAHEVRNWAIVSGDPEVAKQFEHSWALKTAFRKTPTPELKKRLELEGDVHRQSASYFFSLLIEAITKDVRDSVKGVVFGLIYGLGIKRMAQQIKKSLEETVQLVEKFSQRFCVGWEWFDATKLFAAKHLYVESPIKRRRHLYNYMVPDGTPHSNELKAAANRRAVNSVIQGLASDELMVGVRLMERLRWRVFQKTGRLPDIRVTNTVHDSLEVEVGYSDFFLALKFIDHALTVGIRKVLKDRYRYDLAVGLDIDIEVGPDGSNMVKWDNSFEGMKQALVKALDFQKKGLLRKFDQDQAFKTIMANYHQAPKWLLEQQDKPTL